MMGCTSSPCNAAATTARSPQPRDEVCFRTHNFSTNTASTEKLLVLPSEFPSLASHCDARTSATKVVKELVMLHASELVSFPARPHVNNSVIGLRLDSILRHMSSDSANVSNECSGSLKLKDLSFLDSDQSQLDQLDLAICAYIFCVSTGCFGKRPSVGDSRFVMTYHMVLQLYLLVSL